MREVKTTGLSLGSLMRNKPELPLYRKLAIRMFGYLRVGSIYQKGWKHPLPLFAAHCPDHGYYTDYPHGYDEVVSCPACFGTSLNERALNETANQKVPLPLQH